MLKDYSAIFLSLSLSLSFIKPNIFFGHFLCVCVCERQLLLSTSAACVSVSQFSPLPPLLGFYEGERRWGGEKEKEVTC